MMFRWWIVGVAVACTFALGVTMAVPGAPRLTAQAPPANTEVGIRNIIVVVGDGMGPQHIEAGRRFVHGTGGELVFEAWRYQATTSSTRHDGGVPDSAAGATALATGVLVDNRSISVQQPGDGSPLFTALEQAKFEGKATGLVTTSYVTDATPAAFAAHVSDRGDDATIADWYLNVTRPDVVMGQATRAMSTQAGSAAGYAVVTDRADLGSSQQQSPMAALFGPIAPPGHPDHNETMPTLAEMTAAALDVLDDDPDGLFLVVEEEGTDSYSHRNDIEGVVRSVAELNDAVAVIESFLADNPDTLIVVVADHETGGLQLEGPITGVGEIPGVTWERTGHTATPFVAYATGLGAERLFLDGISSLAELHSLLAEPYVDPPGECFVTGSMSVESQQRNPTTLANGRCGP